MVHVVVQASIIAQLYNVLHASSFDEYPLNILFPYSTLTMFETCLNVHVEIIYQHQQQWFPQPIKNSHTKHVLAPHNQNPLLP